MLAKKLIMENQQNQFSSFIQERMRKAQKNNPALEITMLKTSETTKLLGKRSQAKPKDDDDSDGGLDFIGDKGGKLDIKSALEKGKLSFAEKFGKTTDTNQMKPVRGMFLGAGIDLKRKKVE